LSEEVDICTSILRANTIAVCALGITWVNVVSDNINGDWGDRIITVGNRTATVTD